jgi:hypothetical protein
MVAWPGGEPLWNVPKDLVIFSALRGRPNTVLNRRLPEITARHLFSSFRSKSVRPRDVPTNPTRVETFSPTELRLQQALVAADLIRAR